MKVGIIGFGRLGKLITRYMAQDASLFVYDKIDQAEEIKALNATPATLEEVCQCPIIIPFVPISEFENVILEIKDKISPNALIADVCSVKEWPAEVMKKHLPDSVSILATHPMFGPDSAKLTLMGTKIVLCPVRIEDKLFNDIKSYLESHGIKTIVTDPADHDEQISHSLLLTHFIGRTLMDLKAEPKLIDTKGYRRLMKILETVENDSWQLFEDMNRYNAFSAQTREEFLQSLDNVHKRLLK